MEIGQVDAAARFDRFVTDRGADLWSSAWLLTGDGHHAEDLVQTALLKCYGRFAGFESERAFEAYVRTTMFRTYVSWWRKRSWRSEVPSDVRADVLTSDAGQDPSLRAALQRHPAELPRNQRAVLVLRYFEDRPATEVARMLGMPESTVASHTRRALAALRLIEGVDELRSS